MASNLISDLTPESFATTIQGEKLTLVDFWAPWCGPCRMLTPVLEDLAGEISDQVTIAKVNVETHQGLAGQFGIRGIPHMIVFKNGQKLAEMSGLKSKEEIKSQLARLTA